MSPNRERAARDLGLAVVSARGRLGMTQAELARASGLSAQTLVKVEAGRGGVTLDTLASIADGLGMRLDVDFAGRG